MSDISNKNNPVISTNNTDVTVVENVIVVDSPNVVAKQETVVNIPLASTTNAGASKYYAKHFNVGLDGLVKLRNWAENYVTNFSIDSDKGTFTVHYANGLTKTFELPQKLPTSHVKNNLFTIINIPKNRFIKDTDLKIDDVNQGTVYYCLITSSETGFNDADFIVSLEESSNFADVGENTSTTEEKSITGYYTVMDSVLKGEDGSLLILANDAFDCRVILAGGTIFTGGQVLSLSYVEDENSTDQLESLGVLTITYVNGQSVAIKFKDIVKKYGDEEIERIKQELNDKVSEILSSVFEFKGIISPEELTDDKLTDDHLNDVWQIKDSFITDDKFIEGANHAINANELITVVKDGDTYKFNVLGSILNVNLNDYYTKDEINEKFKDVTLPDDYINYLEEQTYKNPSIDSFSFTPSITRCEIGMTINITKFNYSVSNQNNIKPNTTLTISTPSGTTIPNVPIDKTSYAYNHNYTPTSIGNKSFKIYGFNNKDIEFYKTLVINVYKPSYIGAFTSDTAEGYVGFTKIPSSLSGTQNVELKSNAYVFFKSSVPISKITLTGLDVSLVKSTEIMYINGVAGNYYVYRTNKMLIPGSYTFVIS